MKPSTNKRVLRFGLKLTLIISTSAMCTMPVAQAQKHTNWQQRECTFDRAQDLFNKEKYAAAQQMFDNLNRQSTGLSAQTAEDAAYYAAICSNMLGNDDAERRLTAFLDKYPQSSHRNMARLHLGNYYYGNGKYKQALAQYKLVDKQNVDFGYRSEFDFKTAYCYISENQHSKAKPLLAQLASGQSKYHNPAQYYYAHIQYMDGEYEQALRNFQELKGNKNFAKLIPSYEARLFYYLGRYDDLLEVADDLIADDQVFRRDEIAQMVADVHYNKAQYRDALKYYNLSQKLTPQPEAKGNSKVCTPQDNYYQMGYCYYMTHQYDSATHYLMKKTVCDDSIAQNALYTLGDIYLKQGDKDAARSMFLQASRMSHNAAIKEDALFNYAKLSCELNKNPYNESIRSFQSYLKQYPRTKHKKEVQEILASLYLSSRNYKDALTLIESIDDRSVALNRAYQQIVLNRGIELFNTGNENEAASYFKKAAQINVDPRVTADANYLWSEALYRQHKYESASRVIDKFLLSRHAQNSTYYAQGLYTQAYLYMYEKRYDEAAEQLKKYISAADENKNAHQYYDAYNRLGDCQYVSKHYTDAIGCYKKVVNAKDADADYATFQQALCYGALGKVSDKLNHLNYIFERYPNSSYASKAQLEIARTYLANDNNEKALLYYNNFVKKYPKSTYVKDALLDIGVIYYNESRYDEALATLDNLLTQYPGTQESRNALSTVKNIYIKQNRVEDYFAYVRRTTKMTISSVEEDSTTYMAAENRYMEGQYDVAASLFESYLDHYDNGLYRLQADYYAADALFRIGQNERALPHYEAVAGAPKSQYSESALSNGANIAYSLEEYPRALALYHSLALNAESDNARLQGLVGEMRCYVRQNAHDSLRAKATALLNRRNTPNDIRDEAIAALARDYYASGMIDSADRYYRMVANSSNGELAGEAIYYSAETQFKKAQSQDDATARNKGLIEAEQLIETIVANPTSDHYLAKSFILWADIYYARGNNLQAKQTLLSIIENYDGADLVKLAQEKLDAIIAEETPVAEEDNETPVIELSDNND